MIGFKGWFCSKWWSDCLGLPVQHGCNHWNIHVVHQWPGRLGPTILRWLLNYELARTEKNPRKIMAQTSLNGGLCGRKTSINQPFFIAFFRVLLSPFTRSTQFSVLKWQLVRGIPEYTPIFRRTHLGFPSLGAFQRCRPNIKDIQDIQDCDAGCVLAADSDDVDVIRPKSHRSKNVTWLWKDEHPVWACFKNVWL